MENQETTAIKAMAAIPRRSREDMKHEVLQILSSLQLNRTEIQRVLNIPERYQLSYARSLVETGSRLKSIKMKCYECMGWESLRERIGNCGCRVCPLWMHRPFQNDDKESVVEEEEIEID